MSASRHKKPATPAGQRLPSGSSADRYSVDLDIGGTFTDAIFSRKGFAKLIKVETTPHDLSVCFRKAIEKAAEEFGFESLRLFLGQVRVIRLSTSLSTNVLLERKGLFIGLILDRGWRDIFLGLRVFPQGAAPPVAPNMVVEVGNRPKGAEIREAAYHLIREGADILVISLNDPQGFTQAERDAKGIIHQFYANHFIGSIPVVTSGQLSRGEDYVTRSSRIVLNTYAHGVVAEPFLKIEDQLREQGYAFPLLLVHADGGSSRVSKTTAEQTISSGASAGIFGAQRLAGFYGLKKVVTVDIGGTSTEIGVIKEGGIVPAQLESELVLNMTGGSPVAFTVGIGGGSVVRVDQSGRLDLGPESVGAFPGPVCYDLGGTEPTLTDAFLLLGYFEEGYFLGGERRLNRRLADAVFRERIAGPLGLSCEAAAWLVKQTAVRRIAGDIGRVLSSQGFEPAETDLFAVGGCGGCMGCDLYDAAGLRALHVFRQGSVFGAHGSSGMDVVHRYEAGLCVSLGLSGGDASDGPEKINASVLALQRKAFLDMAAEGFAPDAVRFELRVQAESLTTGVRRDYECPIVFLWPGEWGLFHKRIVRLFEGDVQRIEARDLSVTGVTLTATAGIPQAEEDGLVSPVATARAGRRRSIYVDDGGWVGVPVYDWDTLQAPFGAADGCVLEGHDTSFILPPGFEMSMDKRRNARIHRTAKG